MIIPRVVFEIVIQVLIAKMAQLSLMALMTKKAHMEMIIKV